jgi:hypothetical protein
MARMRTAAEKMKVIWANSQLAQGGRDRILRLIANFEEDVRKAISEGQFGEDAQVHPEGIFDG